MTVLVRDAKGALHDEMVAEHAKEEVEDSSF